MIWHLHAEGRLTLCQKAIHSVLSPSYYWTERHGVTCDECLLLIAVAEANDITPETYYEKLAYNNPHELCTFYNAIQWVMNR